MVVMAFVAEGEFAGLAESSPLVAKAILVEYTEDTLPPVVPDMRVEASVYLLSGLTALGQVVPHADGLTSRIGPYYLRALLRGEVTLKTLLKCKVKEYFQCVPVGPGEESDRADHSLPELTPDASSGEDSEDVGWQRRRWCPSSSCGVGTVLHSCSCIFTCIVCL